MPVASSSRQRFADGLIASRGVCGRASARGAALSFGWNFHRAALSEQIFIMRPYAPRKLRPFFDGYIRDMLSGSPFLLEYLTEKQKLLYPARLAEIVRLANTQKGQSRPQEGVSAPNQGPQADA